MTRIPLSRSKGQRSRSPGCFTRRGLNAWGRCSGDRENVLGVGNYRYVGSARRRSRRLGAHGGENGGGISCRHAHSLFNLHWQPLWPLVYKINTPLNCWCKRKIITQINGKKNVTYQGWTVEVSGNLSVRSTSRLFIPGSSLDSTVAVVHELRALSIKCHYLNSRLIQSEICILHLHFEYHLWIFGLQARLWDAIMPIF